MPIKKAIKWISHQLVSRLDYYSATAFDCGTLIGEIHDSLSKINCKPDGNILLGWLCSRHETHEHSR
jgi:hypothetical protein